MAIDSERAGISAFNTHQPAHNHLLAALPANDLALLAPHLELVPMALGQMLYEPGCQMHHAYFPTTAIISLHYVTESGASAETAGIVAGTNRGTKLIKGRGSAPVSNGNTGSVGTVETRVGSDSEGMSEGGNKMSSFVKRS